jgi:hypothetical protein
VLGHLEMGRSEPLQASLALSGATLNGSKGWV